MKDEVKGVSLFAILCILYCIVIKIFFHTSDEILFRYFLCQLLIVFVPGYALVKLIDFQGTLIEKISISYTVGYTLNIIEYLIVYGLRFQRFALLFGIIVAIISTIFIYKRADKTVNESFSNAVLDQDWHLLLLLFIIYLFINIMAYSGNAISPLIGKEMTEFPRDVQFWCSNAVALKIDFPPTPTYLDGSILYYHYFSSLQIAYLSQISGIDVFTLSFTLFSFGKCIMLLGGVNYLLNVIGAPSRSKIFYFAAILFMTGEEVKSFVTGLWHTIQAPFGFDIGYALGMWFLGILIVQWKSEKFNSRLFGLCMLFWMTLTGVKAPISMVLIFAAAIFCFIWLMCKNYKNAFGYGGCIVGIFLVVSIVFAGAMRVANGDYEGVSGKLLSFYSLQDVLTVRHSNVILSLIYTIIQKIYYTHPVLLLVTCASSALAIYYLWRKKLEWKECILAIVMLITTCIGLFMGIFIFAGGKSEMYFSMAAFIPCIAYDAELWRLFVDKKLISSIKQLRICALGIFAVSLIGIYNMLFNAYIDGLVTALSDGNKKIHGDYLFPEDSFNRDEALACIWIRDNTDGKAMVVNDRSVIGGKYNDYYVGIFSERQQYLEASDLIYIVELDDLYNTTIMEEVSRRSFNIMSMYYNEISAFEQLKNEGVDYIIQNQMYTPNFIPNNSLVELQYRSGDVSVYKIL